MASNTVESIMKRKICAVKPSSSLADCFLHLEKNTSENQLFLANGTTLVGIITLKSLLAVVARTPSLLLSQVRAIDIADKKIPIAKPSDSISTLTEKMILLNINSLPVISSGEIIGSISLRDTLSQHTITPHITKPSIESNQELDSQLQSDGLESLCSNCGAFSDITEVRGRLLCLDCRYELTD